MDSENTLGLFDNIQEHSAPTTEQGVENYVVQQKKAIDWIGKIRVAGFYLSLAVTPITAIPDPWLLETRRRDAALTSAFFKEVIGRLISRSEALRISRQILERAEQERLMIAECEAARGLQWGERA